MGSPHGVALAIIYCFPPLYGRGKDTIQELAGGAAGCVGLSCLLVWVPRGLGHCRNLGATRPTQRGASLTSSPAIWSISLRGWWGVRRMSKLAGASFWLPAGPLPASPRCRTGHYQEASARHRWLAQQEAYAAGS